MGNVVQLPGVRELPRRAPKSLRSTTEAVILTKEGVATWRDPPFQRPLRVNMKVLALAETMKNDGGILPGILTLGVLDGKKYLVDGQHRVEAFKISELPEVYAEIRIAHFDSMADMADEFVTLNSKLVTMRPDDILRGLEASHPGLSAIRKGCDFIGYDMIRRGASNSPMVSMSVVLRCWFGSATETPVGNSGAASQMVRLVTDAEADKIVQFMNTAFGAWRRDPENNRLWSALNLSLTMWLWRRTVLDGYSAKSSRLTVTQFGKCLLSLAASSDFQDWLVGRSVGERDRSPCYSRIRNVFAERIVLDTGKRPVFPSPPWYQNRGPR